MRRSYTFLQSIISLDLFIQELRIVFNQVPCTRKKNKIKHTLVDVLMSGVAIFLLKYPSLLNFDSRTKLTETNLKNIFKLASIPSDSGLRQILDELDWRLVQKCFIYFYQKLKQIGLHKEYVYLGKHLIVSVDGVQHFCSNKKACSHCLEKKHRNGTSSYSHKMLAAALVKPGRKQVVVIGAEPIAKQDGVSKNDCEQNAAKRLFDWLSDSYTDENFLFVEDALFATAPHVKKILANNWNFVIAVKPESHEKLFNQFEVRRKRGKLITCFKLEKEEGTYHISFFNQVSINKANPNTFVNFLHVVFINKKGEKKIFSWITSIKITKRNAFKLCQIGRARWKIENEVFNTLKNLGYKFEHNYGHGKKNLCTNLAFLMFFAFSVDQFVEALNTDFALLRQECRTRAKFWELQRSCFLVKPCVSFEYIYYDLKLMFGLVNQEPD